MSSHSSKKVIYAALAGNGLIAISKFFAAAATGSSAMLSEGIHSVVDCGNQGLLLMGIRRARRQPDERHPFGYGMELYFWTFVVAILIFAVGSGVSFYEGYQRIQHPAALTSPGWNYGVLGVSMIFEGAAWYIAFKEFNKTREGRPFLRAISSSKDPTVFTVLFEDTAAMLGLIVAFLGILGAQVLDLPQLDGAASIGIGIILACVAIVLAKESKGLLIGEAADPSVLRDIKNMVAADEQILRVNEILSMHLGPNDILLNASLDFSPGISSDDVEKTISRFEEKIKQKYPAIRRIFIEAQSWRAHAEDAAKPDEVFHE